MDTNKTILVTGGTGFVGSYLLRYLAERGYTRIRALRRAGSAMDLVAPVADRVEWVECDILDQIGLEEAMAGIEQVYHCAAVISFDKTDRQRLMQVNVEGTANVVNAALYAGVEKLVHTSSIAALGRTRDGETLSEQNIWQRGGYNSNYSISKFLAEQEVWRGIAEGLQAAIVNPSIIMGSGRWNEGTSQTLSLVWKNFPFYPKGGAGFVDVRDVCRMMIRLMESGISGERFVVSSENLSHQELLSRLAVLLGRRPPWLKLRPWVQQIASSLLAIPARVTGRKPAVTKEVAWSTAQTFFFDNRKSIDRFQFQYTPLEETLALTCRQFLEASNDGFTSRVMPLGDRW